MIRNTRKKSMRSPYGYRNHDNQCNKNRFQKVPGKQEPDTFPVGSKYFADTYFFTAFFCKERRKAEQAETGNKDGHTAEDGCNQSDSTPFCKSFLVTCFCKRIFKRIIVIYLLYCLLDLC